MLHDVREGAAPTTVSGASRLAPEESFVISLSPSGSYHTRMLLPWTAEAITGLRLPFQEKNVLNNKRY